MLAVQGSMWRSCVAREGWSTVRRPVVTPAALFYFRAVCDRRNTKKNLKKIIILLHPVLTDWAGASRCGSRSFWSSCSLKVVNKNILEGGDELETLKLTMAPVSWAGSPRLPFGQGRVNAYKSSSSICPWDLRFISGVTPRIWLGI